MSTDGSQASSGASTGDPALRGGLDNRVIAQILHHLAVSTYHMRMYREENDRVLQSLDIVASSVNVLASAGPLSFEFREGRRTGFNVQPPEIKVNGFLFEPQAEEAAWVQSVVSLAKRAGWAKLTLSAGLTVEEGLAFFKAVSLRLAAEASETPGENGETVPMPDAPHILVERVSP